MATTQKELEDIGVELGMLEHTLSTLVSAAKLDGTIDDEEQESIDELERFIGVAKRKREALEQELASASGDGVHGSGGASVGGAIDPRDYTMARIVPGNGGYVYAQYPDGEIVIVQGPNGQKDLPVKRATTAWTAITNEIGNYGGTAASALDSGAAKSTTSTTAVVSADEAAASFASNEDSLLNDLYQQEAALVIAYQNAGSEAEREQIWGELEGTREEIAEEKASIAGNNDALVSVDGEFDEELPEFHHEGASDYEFPVGITVISTETDEGDTDLGLAAVRLWYALNGGYVAGDSVKEMVDAIIEKADGRLINELTITGHASSGDQNISDEDSIAAGFGAEKRKELARLKGYFAEYAVVTLQGCEVGAGVKGEQLLKELATLWGVRVRGGVPYQRPVLYRGMEGSVTTAVPTENGVEIEQDDSVTNEFWRTHPPELRPWKPPVNDDVNALKWVQTAPDEQLTNLSLQNRYLLAKTLISGYTGNDEGEATVTLFRSAKQADRRELYRLLESHKWEGEFHSGVFTDDDGLVNALSEPQLEELKYLLG